MRKIILLTLLLFATQAAYAQKHEFGDFYKKYSKQESIKATDIGKFMLRMMRMLAPTDEKAQEMVKMFDGADRVRILNPDEMTDQFKADLDQVVKSNGFELYNTKEEEGVAMDTFVRNGSAEAYSEVILLFHLDNKGMVVHVQGSMREDALKLMSEMKFQRKDKAEH